MLPLCSGSPSNTDCLVSGSTTVPLNSEQCLPSSCKCWQQTLRNWFFGYLHGFGWANEIAKEWIVSPVGRDWKNNREDNIIAGYISSWSESRLCKIMTNPQDTYKRTHLCDGCHSIVCKTLVSRSFCDGWRFPKSGLWAFLWLWPRKHWWWVTA